MLDVEVRVRILQVLKATQISPIAEMDLYTLFPIWKRAFCQRIVIFSWIPFEAKLWKSVSWFDRCFTEKQCLRTHLSQPKAAVCHCYHTYQQVAKISRCIQFNTQYTWQDHIKYGKMQSFWAHQRLSMPVIRTYRWLLFCEALKKSPHSFSVRQWKNWKGLSAAFRLSCTHASRNNNGCVLEPI